MEPNTTQPTINNNTKNSKNLIYVLVAAFVILLVGIVLVVSSNKSKTNNSAVISQEIKQKPALVEITDSGFVPSTISVNKNQAIIWTNNTDSNHLVATDPYPTDNGVKGFKSNVLNPNDSYAFILPNKSGTYTYHDDLNPYKFKGVIIIK